MDWTLSLWLTTIIKKMWKVNQEEEGPERIYVHIRLMAWRTSPWVQ